MAIQKKDFENALEEAKRKAIEEGKQSLTLTAGDIHRTVGVYPKPNHFMRLCCKVMRESMQEQNGDCVVYEPQSGEGASLKIIYYLTNN